jgi:L-alanine-DL-glutamate epimerase-like enolase superfamily enzyme
MSVKVSDALFTSGQHPRVLPPVNTGAGPVAFLFAEIRAESGYEGVGYSYAKRAGGAGQYAHAREIAPELIGEDPSDIQRLWTKLVWAGASVGRSGLATQAIAAIDIALWDLKAKRAGLPLAKLLGAHRDSVACYNTSGGFLSMSIEQVLQNAGAAAAYETDPWVEHFDWLEPLFNERTEIRDGRMLVPNRPGLGFSLSDQARAWTRESETI